MKLQKQVAYKVKGKPYYKFVLNVPPNRVEQLGWEEGLELKDEVKGKSLVICPINANNIKKDKEEILYEEFRDSIKKLLERHPSGLTWTQIRDKLSLPQEVPNNNWVKRLKKDIGLEQIKVEGSLLWNFEYDAVYTIGYEGYTLEKFVKKLKLP